MGKTVIITAGPTQEPIDAVRFLSNHSSGMMGFSIASACQRRGAKVHLITGPVSLNTPYGVDRIDVQTAAEMQRAVNERLGSADVFIASAAVADYTCQPYVGKITSQQQPLLLKLVPTEDILANVCRNKQRPPLVVGFALQHDEDWREKAQTKWRKKDCDWLVVNHLADGLPFGDRMHRLYVWSAQEEFVLGPASKSQLAEELVQLWEI